VKRLIEGYVSKIAFSAIPQVAEQEMSIANELDAILAVGNKEERSED